MLVVIEFINPLVWLEVGTRVDLHVRVRRVEAAQNIDCSQTTLNSLNRVWYVVSLASSVLMAST